MEHIVTMETLTRSGRGILQKLNQIKYPLLVLLIGVAILLLPDWERTDAAQTPETVQEPSYELEEKLEALLSTMEGAGQVRVLLTLETGPETMYQEDQQRSSQGDTVEVKRETVLVSEGGDDVPVVVKTTYPVYKGAVVVCQGADSAAVRLNIVQAVSSLTGLGSDKITVVKMKG